MHGLFKVRELISSEAITGSGLFKTRDILGARAIQGNMVCSNIDHCS